MKRILITGEGSYVGTSLEKWLNQWPDEYKIYTINVKNNDWKHESFSYYDVVYHVAAIVHVKERNSDKYFKINRDLAVEVAKKAREDGVKQFIFLSTMGVYGTEAGYITKEIMPEPKTLYAKSKYTAEQLLKEMITNEFIVSIIRAPIVYGKDCRGNYPRLANIALQLLIFPKVNNERSMIYIDYLSEFIRLIIDYEASGLFFPQNREYVNTTELVSLIAKMHGKNLRVTDKFNFVINFGIKYSKTFRKVFGSFVYDKELPGGPGTLIEKNVFNYETCSYEESIIRTEKEDLE